MINLPFDKWTLKFESNDFENKYEKHENKIRLLCFRLILCFVCIAGLACLMVFTAQQKPTYLVLVVIGIIVSSFFTVLLCHKMEAYMKQVFSFILVFGTCIYILIEQSQIEIPHGVLGYSVGCSTMGLIQYSDNRIKLVFIFVGINVLLGVFNIFQLSTLHFVIYGYTSMIFVGSLAYMNEYTARLSFSLNLKLEKLKELIDEFSSDAICAISLNERSNQFVLEFKNKKIEQLLDIKDKEGIKTFLRSSFFTKQYIKAMKLHGDHPKLLTLEDFLYQKIKQKIFGQTEALQEILYIKRDLKNQTIELPLTISLKIIDYGKPLLILIVKQNEQQNQIDEYEQKIKLYQQQIIQFSYSLAGEQIKIYSQIKKIKLLMSEEGMLKRIQCMNLSLINKIRNHIIYFQKEKISNVGQSFTNFSLEKYLSLISQYCHSLSGQFNRRFKLINQASQILELNINSQFLTQIVINLFEWVLKQSLKHEVITMQIREETSLNPRENQQCNQSVERKEQVELNQKLLSFKIYFYNDDKIDLAKQNTEDIDITQFNICQEVTNFLLALLGPYKISYFGQSLNPESGAEFLSSVQFYIYTDQSKLEPSFINEFHQQKQKKF